MGCATSAEEDVKPFPLSGAEGLRKEGGEGPPPGCQDEQLRKDSSRASGSTGSISFFCDDVCVPQRSGPATPEDASSAHRYVDYVQRERGSVATSADEPSPFMAAITYRYRKARAYVKYGINGDVDQFKDEVANAVPYFSERTRKRVCAWLEQVEQPPPRGTKARRTKVFKLVSMAETSPHSPSHSIPGSTPELLSPSAAVGEGQCHGQSQPAREGAAGSTTSIHEYLARKNGGQLKNLTAAASIQTPSPGGAQKNSIDPEASGASTGATGGEPVVFIPVNAVEPCPASGNAAITAQVPQYYSANFSTVIRPNDAHALSQIAASSLRNGGPPQRVWAVNGMRPKEFEAGTIIELVASPTEEEYDRSLKGQGRMVVDGDKATSSCSNHNALRSTTEPVASPFAPVVDVPKVAEFALLVVEEVADAVSSASDSPRQLSRGALTPGDNCHASVTPCGSSHSADFMDLSHDESSRHLRTHSSDEAEDSGAALLTHRPKVLGRGDQHGTFSSLEPGTMPLSNSRIDISLE